MSGYWVFFVCGEGGVHGVRGLGCVACVVCGDMVFVGKGRVMFVGCLVRICVVSGGISPAGIVFCVAVG